MSLIFLQDRITSIETAFRSNRHSPNSLIYAAREGEASHVPLSSPFEFELTVGSQWTKKLDSHQPLLFAVKNGEIIIPAHSSVVIEVAEDLRLPRNVFGLIFPKGSLFQHLGIFPLTAKIDPTWSGYLRLLVQNSSETNVKVKQGEPIAAVVFIATDVTLQDDLIERRPQESTRERTTLQRIKDKLANGRQMYISTAASIIGAVIGAFITLRFGN